MSLFDKIKARHKDDEREVAKLSRKLARKMRPGGLKNITGCKQWRFVSADGYERLTPYAQKELARRRALGKVAKQSRKRNRGLRPTGGRR